MTIQIDPSLIDRLRQKKPLVLLVNNSVTSQEVANCVNFIGASPICSQAPAEAQAMVKVASSICLNLGTSNELVTEEIRAILTANQKYHRPVVMDPVAAGASAYRLKIAKQVLQSGQVSLIRANAGEVAALIGTKWRSRGIDSLNGNAHCDQIAQKAARQYHCLVLLTGSIDYAADQNQVWLNTVSHANFKKYVGCGDMISALEAAFLGIEQNLSSVLTAVKFFTLAGKQGPRKISAWHASLIDNLAEADNNLFKKWLTETEVLK